MIEPVDIYKSLQNFSTEPKSNAFVTDGIIDELTDATTFIVSDEAFPSVMLPRIFASAVVVIEPVTTKSFPNIILVPPELKNLAVPSCMLTFPLTEIKPEVGSNNKSPPPEDFNSISPSTVCNVILSVPNSLNLID